MNHNKNNPEIFDQESTFSIKGGHGHSCHEPERASVPVARRPPLLRRYVFQKKGAAFLIVLGITLLLTIITYSLYKTTIAGRWLTVRSSNDQKAMDCAEVATNLIFRFVAEEMNDSKMMFDAVSFKKLDFESWFWKFRLPQVIAEGNGDFMKFKNDSISAAQSSGDGLGLEINLTPEMLAKLQKKYKNADLPELEDLVRDMGGIVNINAVAKIEKIYGVLPKSNDYEVSGITVDLLDENDFTSLNVGNFLNSIMDDKDYKIDITNLIYKFMPDINFGDVVKKAIGGMNFNLALYPVAVPIPVGKLLGALLKGLTNKLLGDSSTLQGFLKKTLLKDLKLQIDLTRLKKNIKEKIAVCLPDEIKSLNGKVDWGSTIEKVGVFVVQATVEYQPQGANGVTIKKTMRAQRDFRVADIQPIAPDYTFFVANSKLLFEDPSVENTSNFLGNDEIKWDEGNGSLVIHNISLFDPSLFKKLKDFFDTVGSSDFDKFAHSFFLPGLVRVNGTKKMVIRLNFGLLDFLSGGSFTDALKGCEIAALLVNGREAGDVPKHPILPVIGESIYGTGYEAPPPLGGWVAFFNILEGYLEKIGGGKFTASDFLGVPLAALRIPHFDWPWVCDSKIWIPIPKFYNKTFLFGDFHVEFPLSLRVEGNLWKQFSRLELAMIRIFVPLNWFFGMPNVDITLPPIPMNSTVLEPYGFCSYPPCETAELFDPQKMAKQWDPDKPKNLPANLYSPHQYLKKANYYYETTADFSNDIESRSIEMDVMGQKRKVFICDGVTFVECNDGQGLFFRGDLYVMGRGIIVAAGNIHLKNIFLVDRPEGPPTILSIVARNGALINSGKTTVEACLYGDRGLYNPFYGDLVVKGNLVLNQFNRSDCQGKVNVHFESYRTHSSLMSYFKDVAKLDPTRFHVSLSKKWRQYEFVKN